MDELNVVTVSDARARLTETLKRFRTSPAPQPVVFGSHRRPEAVIVPYDTFPHAAGAQNQSVRAQLRDHAALIERIAQLNTVSGVRVYGSVARGDDSVDSDVDLLVTPGPTTSTFDLAQFGADIELLLQRPVDVTSDRSLDAVRDARVLAEAVPL